MNTSLYQNIIKYSGPEKSTGPSGVIPIAVLKGESTIIEILPSCISFYFRNLIVFEKYLYNYPWLYNI